MNFKQIFCPHRKLTALDMYKRYEPYFTTTCDTLIVKLKCDRCKKLLEIYLENMQISRHENRYDVDVTLLEKYEQFGGKKKVKYEVQDE